MPIRLALVNDYEVVVQGLAHMLDATSDRFDIVELDSGVTVTQDVDIAMYDTFAQTQGGGPGVAALVDNPKVRRVVVYSWNIQQPLIDAALEQGVSGYLSKALTGRELADALGRIHEGEVVTPMPAKDEAEIVVDIAGGDWPGREQGLTPREAEIVALITQGLSNNDIAAKTCLSINSVKSYIRSGYRKMGVTSRTNAVLWGLEHGFAPDRVRTTYPQTR